VASLNYMIL